jgi:hypothetical protein
MKNGSRKPRNEDIKKNYLTHTHPLLGLPYNFCFMKFSAKSKVWPGEVFWPQKASQRPDFLKHTQKPFLSHDLQLFQISLKLVHWFGVLKQIHPPPRPTSDFYIFD